MMVVMTKTSKNYPEMHEISITVKGIKCLLPNINPSKAGGPEKVVGIFLNTLSTELVPFFAHLFKFSYDTGELPSLWKEQWVNHDIYERSTIKTC